MALLEFHAGRFNHKITIKEWHEAPAGVFDVAPSYTNPREIWAAIEPVRGLAIRAMQVDEVPTHLFYFRQADGFRPNDITQTHVIEHNNKRYRVLDTIDINDGRYTRISAKELGHA